LIGVVIVTFLLTAFCRATRRSILPDRPTDPAVDCEIRKTLGLDRPLPDHSRISQ